MGTSNLRIEMISINLLEGCLLKSPYLVPNINKNDKTPSWDGDILIYEKPNSQTKENLKKVQIQVKGHYINKKSDEQFADNISHKIDRKDLENFLNDSGLIYFVIYLSNQEHYKIYYNALTPYDINLILRTSSGKKSKFVNFLEFPINDETDMLDVLLNFHENNRLQSSTVDKRYLSLEEANAANIPCEYLSINMCGLGLSKRNIIDFLFKNPTYIYAKQPNLDIFVPIDKADIEATEVTIKGSIFLNNNLIYSNYKIIHKKNYYILKIGELKIRSDTNMIDFCPTGSLSSRIKDFHFFISLFEKENITIDGKPFNLDIVGLTKNVLERLKSVYKHLLDIKKLLEILGISDDLQLNQLTDEDQGMFIILVNSFIYNINANLEIAYDFLFLKVEVGNLLIFLFAEKDEQNKYKLINFFDVSVEEFYKEKYKDNMIFTLPYISLDKTELITISNITFENIYKSITKSEINKLFLDKLEIFIFEMIKAYDETQNDEMYKTCNNLLQWLIDSDFDQSNKYIINTLQLFKRKRQLNNNEFEYLLELKMKEINLINKTVICILMDNIKEAEYYYNKLGQKDKITFNNNPISFFLPSKF